MVTTATLQLLQDGGLRPGRKYGDFVASRCGRMLEGPDGRLVATPNGVVVTDSVRYASALEAYDVLVVRVKGFDREAVKEAAEAAHSVALQRGLRWVVGR